MSGVYEYKDEPRVAHDGHLYYKNVIRDEADYDLDTQNDSDNQLSVIISGGSMGGLFTALALREGGHDVEVFERSMGELEDRGAGIIAHPPMFDFFENRDIVSRRDIAVSTDRIQWLGKDGNVLHEEDMTIWTTSWGTVYRNLHSEIPDNRYHMGREITTVEWTDESVTARFACSDVISGDLLVAAEGYRSTTRKQLLPSVEPNYSGYVAWRGIVSESNLHSAALEQFGDIYTLYHGPDTQILTYPVPGPNGELEKGERDVNWVWYFPISEADLDDLLLDNKGVQRKYSLPPGAMREEVRNRQVEIAERQLPDILSYLMRETEEPFIQNIYDLSVPQMVFDRVCLLGDAAFYARPHTGSGTAKAASDGLRLGEALNRDDELGVTLTDWEKTQLTLGECLVELGRDRGDRYMGQL